MLADKWYANNSNKRLDDSFIKAITAYCDVMFTKHLGGNSEPIERTCMNDCFLNTKYLYELFFCKILTDCRY